VYPIGTLIEPFAQALNLNTPLENGDILKIVTAFGFDRTPQLPLEVSAPLAVSKAKELHISPLQAALAAAAFSSEGRVPAPRIAMAVNTPQSGWVVLPAAGDPFEAISVSKANDTAATLVHDGEHYWSFIGK